MTEAILAGEQVEDFALPGAAAVLAAGFAPFARLAEDFFVRNSPADAGDRNGKQQQRCELVDEQHDGLRISMRKTRFSWAKVSSRRRLTRVRWAGDGAIEQRGAPRAYREQGAEEDDGVDAFAALARPIHVLQIQPESEFVERECGAHSVGNGEQAADKDVLRSGAAAHFRKPCVTDGEQNQNSPDEVMNVLTANHDPSEGTDVMGDAGDEQADAEEGDKEANCGQEEAAARAVGDAGVENAAEVCAVQQEKDGRGDKDGEDEQNNGAGHCG